MIILDQDILRVKSEPVLLEEVDGLIKTLEKELYYSAILGKPGVGLSAIQLGIKKQAAIVRVPDQYGQLISINLFNAQIKNKYDPFVFKNEGCLSVDNLLKDTVRYQEIHVHNNMVEPYSFVASGLLAVIIQHELDHCNGILFLDRATGKFKPNELCPCGSGKKYKKCCRG